MEVVQYYCHHTASICIRILHPKKSPYIVSNVRSHHSKDTVHHDITQRSHLYRSRFPRHHTHSGRIVQHHDTSCPPGITHIASLHHCTTIPATGPRHPEHLETEKVQSDTSNQSQAGWDDARPRSVDHSCPHQQIIPSDRASPGAVSAACPHRAPQAHPLAPPHPPPPHSHNLPPPPKPYAHRSTKSHARATVRAHPGTPRVPRPRRSFENRTVTQRPTQHTAHSTQNTTRMLIQRDISNGVPGTPDPSLHATPRKPRPRRDPRRLAWRCSTRPVTTTSNE